jgi:hypothetical protein
MCIMAVFHKLDLFIPVLNVGIEEQGTSTIWLTFRDCSFAILFEGK